MSSRETTSPQSGSVAPPEILGVQPQIFVAEMQRAIRFYRDDLGFAVGYLYGEPPYYGLVTRDAAGLNLRHVDHLPIDPEVRDRENLLVRARIGDDAARRDAALRVLEGSIDTKGGWSPTVGACAAPRSC